MFTDINNQIDIVIQLISEHLQMSAEELFYATSLDEMRDVDLHIIKKSTRILFDSVYQCHEKFILSKEDSFKKGIKKELTS